MKATVVLTTSDIDEIEIDDKISHINQFKMQISSTNMALCNVLTSKFAMHRHITSQNLEFIHFSLTAVN